MGRVSQEQDIFPHQQAPCRSFAPEKTNGKLKPRGPSPSKPFPPQGSSPQQNPGIGTECSKVPACREAEREEQDCRP